MFRLKIKINLCVLICFLFASDVIQVATFPTYDSSSCNCILLENCNSFNTFIDKSSDNSFIKSVIQNAVCFFDSYTRSIFVCCPEKFEHKRNIEDKPEFDLDELMGLNCPHPFGDEYSYDEYLKSHNIESSYYDHYSHSSNNNHNRINNHNYTTSTHPYYNEHFPYHHHHHHHYHHHDHDDNFPDKHDYPIERITPMPTKKQPISCGVLPTVLENSTEAYPWIIRLAYLNTTSRTIRYRCMGTIISDQHALTAAHCVDQLVPDLRLIYARIGDDTNFDDYHILETIVHPNYNEPLFNNDVAILKLAVTPQNKGSLKQICLPKNITNTLSGERGIVAGWSSGGISEIKISTIRYITLPIMNNTECAIRYAKYSENFETSIVITPTEFCAKAEAMNDVCEGDSGGPFMERSKSGRYTLLGIVAFGPKTNCGQSNLPGVYMRVSSYVDWIKNSIK